MTYADLPAATFAVMGKSLGTTYAEVVAATRPIDKRT